MSYILYRFRQELDKFTFSDYHGLSSPGVTCYLNSVLQVLFMTADYREAVKSIKNSTSFDFYMGRLFTDLQKRMARTHDITRKLGITDVFKQRDAAEYFEKIMSLSSPEASKIFQGELSHITRCLKCKEQDESRSFFWTLPLVMNVSSSQAYSVEDGLKSFLRGEEVSGDNKLYCNFCKKKQTTDLICEIKQHPDILTLMLKRFTFSYKHDCNVKLHCKVDVPQTLNMKRCSYDLYALVNHHGHLTGGHYTAQVKSFENGEWYYFSDINVTKVRRFVYCKSIRNSV
ncbi:ubiquitin carboxyl-terminal hydrolase 47-like [Xenentodon cancila]